MEFLLLSLSKPENVTEVIFKAIKMAENIFFPSSSYFIALNSWLSNWNALQVLIKEAISGYAVMESPFSGADWLLPHSRRIERSDKPKATKELLQIAGCDSPPHKISHYKPAQLARHFHEVLGWENEIIFQCKRKIRDKLKYTAEKLFLSSSCR